MERVLKLFFILLIAVIMAPGCIAEEKQSVSDQKAADLRPDYSADENVTSLNVSVNDTILVKLSENPTTGYSWNATVTDGLVILNDTYVQDDAKEGMVGVGGVHEWLLQAIAEGNQSFDGIYKRSWEPIYGNETTYNLSIEVK